MAKKTTNENVNPIETAERVLADLQKQHDKTVALRDADDRELGSLSYSALAAGDKDSAEKLERVKERVLRRDLELRTIRSAIAQGQQRLEDAKTEAAKADERRVALEGRGLLRSLKDAGKVCDDALVMFADGSNVMREIIAKLNALGFHHPSAMQLQSLGERAVRTALVNTAFARAFEAIPPRERQHFIEFTSRWAESLEREIAARLGESKQKEDAA